MATKSTPRFLPSVERLESLVLLSHVQAGTIHAEAKTPTVPVDVALAGTLHGTGKLSGSEATASELGNLGQVGTASFSVKANIDDPPSKVTLTTKKGNITLAAEGSALELASGYSVEMRSSAAPSPTPRPPAPAPSRRPMSCSRRTR